MTYHYCHPNWTHQLIFKNKTGVLGTNRSLYTGVFLLCNCVILLPPLLIVCTNLLGRKEKKESCMSCTNC